MRKSLPTCHSRMFLAGINLLLLWTIGCGLLIPSAHAKLENGMDADVVLGQPDFDSGVAGLSDRNFNIVDTITTDGKKLFVADAANRRILVFDAHPRNHYPTAEIVLGQSDFNSNVDYGATDKSVYGTTQIKVFTDGIRLYVSDYDADRVLIWNSLPKANFTPADVVLGQPDFNTRTAGLAGNRMNLPVSVCVVGNKLFVAEQANHRVLVWNSVPTQNNIPADVVIGQPDFTTNVEGTSRNRFRGLTNDVYSDGKRLFIADFGNHRVLIFNIGSSAISLGPQFEQGKAVVGKVFNDLNGNGIQDRGSATKASADSSGFASEEKGIEGVKVVSDTGIYAITDEDGKYHFPYIETGQHLLKIDESTLPEGSTITTDSPYKITVTKGILTKVSFGVRLPEHPADSAERIDESLSAKRSALNAPLLKVSISQDPALLKPRLSVSAREEKDKVIFTIDCNYSLFIERSELILYDKDLKPFKTITLPNPLPLTYEIPLSVILSATGAKNLNPRSFGAGALQDDGVLYFQLKVYDKEGREGREDRTGVGQIRLT